MVDREVQWRYPVMAAAITAVVFSLILGSGFLLNDYKVDSLQQRMETVEIEQNSRMIGQELSTSMEENSCRAIGQWMNATVEDMRILKKEVSAYENTNKIENPSFKTGKKRYTNLLLQNLVQVHRYNRNCNEEIVDIVYFYGDNCDACEDQGTVLTQIRRDYDQDVVVYPLDTELEMPAVEFLHDYYGIEQYPSVVVDGEVMQGFQSMEDIEQAVDSSLNSTDQNRSAMSSYVAGGEVEN